MENVALAFRTRDVLEVVLHFEDRAKPSAACPVFAACADWDVGPNQATRNWTAGFSPGLPGSIDQGFILGMYPFFDPQPCVSNVLLAVT